MLANALVERYGAGQFPTPAALAAATPAELGMPGLRGQAISSLAQQVAQGSLHLDGQPQELRAELLQIPGIGPWTAEYVAMRVARDADAFVATDWVVRKQLGLTPAAARRWAEPMRPWRAYAVMYLWWAAAAGVTC